MVSAIHLLSNWGQVYGSLWISPNDCLTMVCIINLPSLEYTVLSSGHSSPGYLALRPKSVTMVKFLTKHNKGKWV